MNKDLSVLSFSLFHFIMDTITVGTISSIIYTEHFTVGNTILLLILYNSIAFGLQPIFGYMADKTGKWKEIIFCGYVIGIIGLLWTHGILAIIFLGIASTLFHAGSGRFLFGEIGISPSATGFFTSSGALGTVLGAFLGFGGYFNPSIAGCFIGVLSCIIIFTKYKKHIINQSLPIILPIVVSSGLHIIIVIILILAIACRSYIGVIIQDVPFYSFLSLGIIATTLGKFLGGYIWEKIGNKNMFAFLIIGSIVGWALGIVFPIFGLLNVFILFSSTTMGIFLILGMFPKLPALSFCIAEGALALGGCLAIISTQFVVQASIIQILTFFSLGMLIFISFQYSLIFHS